MVPLWLAIEGSKLAISFFKLNILVSDTARQQKYKRAVLINEFFCLVCTQEIGTWCIFSFSRCYCSWLWWQHYCQTLFAIFLLWTQHVLWASFILLSINSIIQEISSLLTLCLKYAYIMFETMNFTRHPSEELINDFMYRHVALKCGMHMCIYLYLTKKKS